MADDGNTVNEEVAEAEPAITAEEPKDNIGSQSISTLPPSSPPDTPPDTPLDAYPLPAEPPHKRRFSAVSILLLLAGFAAASAGIAFGWVGMDRNRDADRMNTETQQADERARALENKTDIIDHNAAKLSNEADSMISDLDATTTEFDILDSTTAMSEIVVNASELWNNGSTSASKNLLRGEGQATVDRYREHVSRYSKEIADASKSLDELEKKLEKAENETPTEAVEDEEPA